MSSLFEYHFFKTDLVLKAAHKLTSSSGGGGISFLGGSVILSAQQLPYRSLEKYISNLTYSAQVQISHLKKIKLSSSEGIFFVEERIDKYHKLKKVFKKNQTLTMIELTCYLKKQEYCAEYAYLLDHLRWK